MIGKIDDVRIYSRSLSDDEISALYLSEKPKHLCISEGPGLSYSKNTP